MPDFLISLVLLAVSQIPLLLKLWLDHKGTISGYKLELYRRQLDAYKAISISLESVFRNSSALATLTEERTLPADKDDEFFSSIKKSYFDDIRTFGTDMRSAQLILPAKLVVDCFEFESYAMRLLFKAFEIGQTPGSREWSVSELWAKAQELYNSMTNQMRHAGGIDALSNQVIDHLNDRKTRTWLLTNFTTSLLTNPNSGVQRTPESGRH